MWSPPCTSHPSTGCAALPQQGPTAQSKARLLIQAQGNSTGVMRIKSRITRPININSTAEPPELGIALATAASPAAPPVLGQSVSGDCDTNFRQRISHSITPLGLCPAFSHMGSPGFWIFGYKAGQRGCGDTHKGMDLPKVFFLQHG